MICIIIWSMCVYCMYRMVLLIMHNYLISSEYQVSVSKTLKDLVYCYLFSLITILSTVMKYYHNYLFRGILKFIIRLKII